MMMVLITPTRVRVLPNVKLLSVGMGLFKTGWKPATMGTSMLAMAVMRPADLRPVAMGASMTARVAMMATPTPAMAAMGNAGLKPVAMVASMKVRPVTTAIGWIPMPAQTPAAQRFVVTEFSESAVKSVMMVTGYRPMLA